MNIKSCYVPKYKAHITRYQELQHSKQTRKVLLLDYSEKIKASITSLQNNSSSAPPSIVVPKVSLHQITLIHLKFQASPLIFGIDGNSQKLITSYETRLTIAIADFIISEGLPFNLSQRPRFKKFPRNYY